MLPISNLFALVVPKLLDKYSTWRKSNSPGHVFPTKICKPVAWSFGILPYSYRKHLGGINRWSLLGSSSRLASGLPAQMVNLD